MIETSKEAFLSAETDVRVGITILLAAQGKSLTVAAMIDDRLVSGYDFDIEIRLPMLQFDVAPTVVRQKVIDGKAYVHVDQPASVDWSSVAAIYLGPDDPRIVRSEIIAEDALKSPQRSGSKTSKP